MCTSHDVRRIIMTTMTFREVVEVQRDWATVVCNDSKEELPIEQKATPRRGTAAYFP